ncbi:MAG: DDE-type integrase/transposase/recombinase, partial [Armatimonadota bacterium]
MEVFPASVTLVIRALVVSARWTGRARRLALEQATAAADANREAALEARVMVLEDMVEQRDAHIEVLESRLGEKHSRKPYPLMERLRIIWLMQYFQIPGRRLKEMLGVSRSSVRRWLKGFEEGRLGKGNEPKEPVNKTPREMAELIWEIFRENPLWGRWRIAMVLWGLGVFVAASTVRNILLRPRPEASAPAVAQVKDPVTPRQIIARYPNHVWSVDRTRVWRWHIWPTWAFVAVDHFSRMVTAVCPLEGPNAGWVVEALEEAFLRHGAPKHLISDQEGVFAGEVFAALMRDWNIKQRFGAVGRHGSIAVTERVILTLKQEWLKRVPVIRGLDHLSQLLDDFSEYYNHWRGHSTIGGA